MTTDFDKMSITELQAVIIEVENIIARKMDEEKSDVLNEMKALAKARGFDFSELVGGKKFKPKAIPKYRNPANRSETWSGLGRKPKWISDVLNQGKTLDEVAI